MKIDRNHNRVEENIKLCFVLMTRIVFHEVTEENIEKTKWTLI